MLKLKNIHVSWDFAARNTSNKKAKTLNTKPMPWVIASANRSIFLDVELLEGISSIFITYLYGLYHFIITQYFIFVKHIFYVFISLH